MAAETLTTTRGASTYPVAKPTGAGVVCAAYGTYTVASGNLLEAGDVIQFCRVPAGAVVLGGWLYGADIDTGTETLDIDIGWAANGVESADTDGFGNLGVLDGDVFTDSNLGTVAAIQVPFQGVLAQTGPQAFTNETVITGYVNTAANAGGTGAISVVVYYVVP